MVNFSVFTRSAGTETDDPGLVDVLRQALEPLPEPAKWRSTRSGMWCHVSPAGSPRRDQGWKLHVSATPASAGEVLGRSLPVLLSADSAFKFAATTTDVAVLTARNASRGHSGKFITVYPGTDDEAVRLARELDAVTAGLPGPRILSDRPYSRGSLVHYRYGAFIERRRITNDGFYAWEIVDPDGNRVEDRRQGRYTPPSWASCPFPDNGLGRVTEADGDGVLIGKRLPVREAIRHSNKGGVYRALDTSTGDMVVIKEARPHVAADDAGRDVRDQLRAEARALEAIRELKVAPRPILLFPQSGHLFLAEELIAGAPLRRLIDLVITAHGAGLILRDFNPNNIMVRPDGRPVLIDLELATLAGDPAEQPVRAGTPGYAAPEQLSGAAPAVSADSYSLGATLCHVLTGAPPHFLDDHSPRLWTTDACATPGRP